VIFEAGERVRTRVMNPDGHTRIPVYLRGRPGRVLNFAGVFRFSDAVVAGRPEVVEPLYTVMFAARDLWGADADPSQSVTADLYESYLEKDA
jgi:nitrile hydratase subunit beta